MQTSIELQISSPGNKNYATTFPLHFSDTFLALTTFSLSMTDKAVIIFTFLLSWGKLNITRLVLLPDAHLGRVSLLKMHSSNVLPLFTSGRNWATIYFSRSPSCRNKTCTQILTYNKHSIHTCWRAFYVLVLTITYSGGQIVNTCTIHAVVNSLYIFYTYILHSHIYLPWFPIPYLKQKVTLSFDRS